MSNKWSTWQQQKAKQKVENIVEITTAVLHEDVTELETLSTEIPLQTVELETILIEPEQFSNLETVTVDLQETEIEQILDVESVKSAKKGKKVNE